MIQACLNGRRTRSEHPRIPFTPEELAQDGQAAVAAGARSIHIHPRDAHGLETLDAEPRAAALRALREACPGIEVSVTTGFWIVNDEKRRLELIASWTELPDLASVNINEPGAAELCRTLAGRGIGIEVGIANLGDAQLLIDSGVVPACKRILVEVEGEASEALVQIAAIDAKLVEGGIELPHLDHGQSRATWAVLDRAIRLGHDMRIGFEDTLTMADSRPALSNAELVAALATRVTALEGRERRGPFRRTRSSA